MPQRRALRASKDQLVIIYVHALDVLTDDRHDHCRYNDHTFARIGLGRRKPESAAGQLGQLPRDTDCMRDKAAALAPPRPVPLASGSGLGRPARRSGPGRLTPIPRSKRLIAVVIGREVQASTFILPG